MIYAAADAADYFRCLRAPIIIFAAALGALRRLFHADMICCAIMLYAAADDADADFRRCCCQRCAA